MKVTTHNKYYNTQVTVEVGEYPSNLIREVDDAWAKFDNNYLDIKDDNKLLHTITSNQLAHGRVH